MPSAERRWHASSVVAEDNMEFTSRSIQATTGPPDPSQRALVERIVSQQLVCLPNTFSASTS